MLKRKNIKLRGKIRLSQYFQEFKNGEKVAIVREHSLNPAIPKRIQGLTGTIVGKRGRAYIISVKEGKQRKLHIIKPAHLKKLK
jgi:large subunit ribosomal protein L21e